MYNPELIALAASALLATLVSGFWYYANLKRSKTTPPPEEVYGTDAAVVDKDIAELCRLWRELMPEELQQEKDDLKLAILAREYLITFARQRTSSTILGYLEWWNCSSAQAEASRLMKKAERALDLARRAHQLKACGCLREAFIEYGKALHVLGYAAQCLSYVSGCLALSNPIKPFAS